MRKQKDEASVFEIAASRRNSIVAILKEKNLQTAKEIKEYFPNVCLGSIRSDLFSLEQCKRIKRVGNEYPFRWSVI